jgi:hypothetical protein
VKNIKAKKDVIKKERIKQAIEMAKERQKQEEKQKKIMEEELRKQ